MTTRFLFNTSGEYVAFVSGQNVWTPSGEWLGFIPQGNLVFSSVGAFLGEISQDDRLIRNTGLNYQNLLVPSRPLRPATPLRPLKRLKMPPLPWPYLDVFENGHRGANSHGLVQSFEYLLNGSLWGCDPDKTFLGNISTNRFDQYSILNQFSLYGSKFSATSIFNEYGLFGGKYGQYSPFNEYSLSPPQVVLGDKHVGILTVNTMIQGNIINAHEFLEWLKSI